MKKSVLRFLVVGGSATIIDYCFYMVFGLAMEISVAKICSMCISSIYSYILNKVWTFEANEKSNIVFIVKYYVTFFCNVCVNVFVNRISYYYLVESITLRDRVAKTLAFVLATGIAMTINFILQRFWVFKAKETNNE